MSLENDIDWSLKQQAKDSERRHEQAMRKTVIKKAKIEAKRDVKIARAKNDGYLFYKGMVIFLTLLAAVVITGIIVARSNHNPALEQLQENHSQQLQLQCQEKTRGDWVWNPSEGDCEHP